MRILGTLFLLLLVFAVLGWFRGWFVVESAAATRSGPRVVVDSDKVAGDARAAADKIGELSAKATSSITAKATPATNGLLSIEGEVITVDLAKRRVDLRIGGDDLTMDVPDSTPITIAGTSKMLADLQTGQKVQLSLQADGTRLLLKSIDAK
jgi:hypothetical protein